MIIPVFISSKTNPQKEHLVYALVDSMSDSTFVTEDAVTDLEAPCTPAKLRLTTLTNNSQLISCKKYSDLQVRRYGSNTYVSLPGSFSRNHIPVDESHIPTPETASCWPHLLGVKDLLVPKQSCPVGLLIGYNCPQALAPLQCITGDPNQPFAIETSLGWSIIGGPPPQVEPFDAFGKSHCVITKAVSHTGLVRHVYKTQVQEVTTGELLHLMERDFTDHDTQKMSQDDHSFLRILNEGIHQRSDGFYEMPLPFKQAHPNLCNNRQGALHRALSLQKQLLKRPTYREHYMSFMEDLIEQGEAEKVPQEELHSAGSKWYIPHHGVYHPEKPNKVRVVFDCSARYHGTSLNDHLLQGPDLINPLVGVLSRFRKGSIAFTCDVQKMYYQFRVPKEQQDYLRFLWWEGGDLSKPPVDYRMKVHLFGATSSPGCANFGLKQIGRDYRYLSETAADFLDRNFYVDDGLRAEETVAQAKEVISNAREICAKANLRLHKITSNSEEVVKTIPESERAGPTQTNVDIDNGSESMTLGLRWCTSDDTLRFKLRLKEKPQTRRGLLATVASVYDPLGLIAPVVLVGRQILQAMCKQNLGWDDRVPEDLRPLWERWIDDLQQLQNLQIPRCYHPASFGKPVKAQLHHFSDASTTGCGQCSYLRLENVTGDIHCALVMGKTRVVPLKPTTIPRLELQAATLSAKAATFLSSELDYPNLTHHFWTDSKVVLGYIKNESKRFHMFVANRVQQICQNSQPEQWNYVSTAENPADHASRGLTVNELKSSIWFSGPEFLWKREITPEDVKLEIPTDDVEVKSATTHFSHQSPTSFEDRVSRFSSYIKLVRAVAAIVKCCSRKKGKVLSELEARQRAERNLIHAIQDEFFTQSDQQTNPLRDLDPFKDDEGLLRVGGRLKKSSEPHRVKHPVILPKKSHLGRLVALDLHERIAHQGRNMTINEIRSKGFWITGCRHVVSSLISKCIKQRGKGKTQKMADLPEERVDASPPFTHCGLDCFGPFMIKEGRKELKRYGLLITCMASRAVHIEVLDDMSTDSFLNGLRCFIALRGKVRTIFSDQGTNFVGAKHELDRHFEQLNRKTILAKLLDLQCEFKFNPPSSSHMGGVWERQIRSVRSVLTGILDQSSTRLDTSSLRTLMYEVMAIINSRPLSVEHLERADGPLPLTPNHILTMKSGLIMPPPPGCFVKEDLYLNKRWKRVQFLADLFWTRWRKEYLQSLQGRSKWQKPQTNVAVDDIVLLQDESDCRNDWKIARIVEARPSKDGHVRKVKLLMSTSALDNQGKPVQQRTLLDRPIHKLVVLVKVEQPND
ncbi:uncharacterized protein [Littorina saxatilis]|uniref:uncharacterized protein n=1 Tax=Littorina saxatilis TaxID=31220 RepID=UPI0038B66D70